MWLDARLMRLHSTSSTTYWPVRMAPSGEMGQREQGGCFGLQLSESSWTLPLNCILYCLLCVYYMLGSELGPGDGKMNEP